MAALKKLHLQSQFANGRMPGHISLYRSIQETHPKKFSWIPTVNNATCLLPSKKVTVQLLFVQCTEWWLRWLTIPRSTAESARGLAHSTTWRTDLRLGTSRSVLECGSPLPLFVRQQSCDDVLALSPLVPRGAREKRRCVSPALLGFPGPFGRRTAVRNKFRAPARKTVPTQCGGTCGNCEIHPAAWSVIF